jgi:hypothetical protein
VEFGVRSETGWDLSNLSFLIASCSRFFARLFMEEIIPQKKSIAATRAVPKFEILCAPFAFSASQR